MPLSVSRQHPITINVLSQFCVSGVAFHSFSRAENLGNFINLKKFTITPYYNRSSVWGCELVNSFITRLGSKASTWKESSIFSPHASGEVSPSAEALSGNGLESLTNGSALGQPIKISQ
jgi:hypothetical protein|tara:strand:+ start:1112 stop:1468 length:357 start_codon:yes stop_codon:yes gene_type:complete